MESNSREKHLEMVQAVINRMAGNSFLIKGWSITLVSVILALSMQHEQGKASYATWIALVPALAFWYLDAYYLKQERIFRRLHDAIAEDVRKATQVVPLYSMKGATFAAGVPSVVGTMASVTVCATHGPIVAIVVAVSLLTCWS